MIGIIRISGSDSVCNTHAAEDLANQRSYHHPGRIGYVRGDSSLNPGTYHTIILDGLEAPSQRRA